MSYRWRKSSLTVAHHPDSNAHTNFLTLQNVQTNDAGSYTVILTNNVFFTPGIRSLAVSLTVLEDTDGDRLPDVWEVEHGLNPNDPADASLDTDGDGQSYRHEYQAGTDPLDANSYLKVDAIRLRAGSGSVIVQFLAVSNKTYSVLSRSGPGNGLWSSLADVPATVTNRIVTLEDSIKKGESRQGYYRLVSPRQP